MITAGLSNYSLALFITAALIARGIRYYGLAWLVRVFGPRAKTLWREHALLASIRAAVAVAVAVLTGDYLADLVA